MLGSILYIVFYFPTLHILMILYTILARSRLKGASVVWNSSALTDSSKLKEIYSFMLQ
jgi:hypothetical protein